MSKQEEQQPNVDYLKGFNEGYMLREHLPHLAEQLTKSLEGIDSERASGIQAGSRQYQMEKEKDLTITWMQPNHEGYDDITPEQDMNQDDIDMGKE